MRLLALLALPLVIALPGSAQNLTDVTAEDRMVHEQAIVLDALQVEMVDYGYETSGALAEGWTRLEFENTGEEYHMAGLGRTNRDWWPDRLRLEVLHQHSPKSDPMARGFDYAKEFKRLDYKALKKDLVKLMVDADKETIKQAPEYQPGMEIDQALAAGAGFGGVQGFTQTPDFGRRHNRKAEVRKQIERGGFVEGRPAGELQPDSRSAVRQRASLQRRPSRANDPATLPRTARHYRDSRRR